MATVVIDTNVIAYHLLGIEEHREHLSKLFRKNHNLIAPANIQAGIVNVLWLAIRNEAFDLEEGLQKLEAANCLINRIVPIPNLWRTALLLSTNTDHSPYDTLFVALAEMEDTKLLTYDQQLQNHFSDRAIIPDSYI